VIPSSLWEMEDRMIYLLLWKGYLGILLATELLKFVWVSRPLNFCIGFYFILSSACVFIKAYSLMNMKSQR
jgi:predicted membrane protein